MSDYLGKNTFKLGFGLMRLPKLSDGKSEDIDQTKKMVDMFLVAGGTYFDTAYVYDDGLSEEATKLALVDRYPRDKYTLCTKLCAWLQCHDEASAKQQFYTSLKRTGAGYFDYYLLHALQRNNYKKYDEYHIWEFAQELRQKDLIKNWGFSFHADPDLLEELLTDHPEVDFVQLQINYADWENPGVASRQCWEICRRHNKPVTIMEPVKGGALANPIQKVQDIFKAAAPEMSFASWAIRFAASLDGIITVLSGMSNIQQMEDNLSYMKDFQPLTGAEQEVVKKAQAALVEDKSIPCTACHYCTGGCPQNIPIPEVFAVKNDVVANGAWDGGKRGYSIATANKGKAGECIQCGQCEAACPQHLSIIELLGECAKAME
ncbi:MAG: 4Fe-4S dicluster domain-containing protein [Acutalibacter sp.]|nr:4Fe-4S dicluster domain-containing protein [Acutalibacter sp.]